MKNKEIYERPILWLCDYSNEFLFLLLYLEGEKDFISVPGLHQKHLVKTLEERIYAGLKKNNHHQSVSVQEIASRYIPKEDIGLFWKKKERLDTLVHCLNEELQKEVHDILKLKSFCNEIFRIIGKVIPFPAVEQQPSFC